MKRLKVKWWLIVGVLLLVLAAALYWLLRSPAFPDDENLVSATAAIADSSGARWFERIFAEYRALSSRFGRNANGRTFAPLQQDHVYSIPVLLNECTELSGTEYFMETNVAEGNVLFGWTNMLNGQQWIEAVEHALQNGQPQWIDSENRQTYENVVLLRYNKKTILVLTPASAQKYREQYPKLVPLER